MENNITIIKKKDICKANCNNISIYPEIDISIYYEEPHNIVEIKTMVETSSGYLTLWHSKTMCTPMRLTRLHSRLLEIEEHIAKHIQYFGVGAIPDSEYGLLTFKIEY